MDPTALGHFNVNYHYDTFSYKIIFALKQAASLMQQIMPVATGSIPIEVGSFSELPLSGSTKS